jgi:hypothetical protein
MNGWLSGVYGADQMTFRRAYRYAAGDHMKRQWEIFEFFKPQYINGFEYRSLVQLAEYDCSGKEKVLSTQVYADSNMSGTNKEEPSSPDWSYLIPGTIAEAMGQVACGQAGGAP